MRRAQTRRAIGSRRDLRFLLLGRTSRGRIVVVAFTERSEDIDTIRLISARVGDRGERHDYEEGQA